MEFSFPFPRFGNGICYSYPIWPFLHFMMFYTIQTIYFLKAGDTHYPVTHCPLTHHPHRPTKPTHSPPYMTISPIYDVLHNTNHIFSESWGHPLSSNPLPTHPSPKQTHHPHKTHPPYMAISP